MSNNLSHIPEHAEAEFLNQVASQLARERGFDPNDPHQVEVEFGADSDDQLEMHLRCYHVCPKGFFGSPLG